MKSQPVMVRRVTAAQATLDHWQGVPFQWGKADCVRMAVFHLKQLGHKVTLAKAGAYSSALGAKRALVRSGYADLPGAMDAHGFARIPPAAALAGDVLLLPGEDGFGALAIALGNGRALCWHPDADGAVVCQPLEYQAAWSVA